MPITDDERVLLGRLNGVAVRQQGPMTQLERYYDGQQRLKHIGWIAPDELLRQFQTVVNVPRVAVDEPVRRQSLKAFQRSNAVGADPALREAWEANNLDSQAPLCHKDARIFGRTFVSVGSNPDDPGHPLIQVENPREFSVVVDQRRRRIKAALRSWRDDVEHVRRATLYLPDRTLWLVNGPDGWVIDDVDEHRLGAVPVVMFLNKARAGRWDGTSEMTDVLGLTDGIARLATNMLVGAESHSLPDKWAIGVRKEDFVDRDGNPIPTWETYASVIKATSNTNAKFGQFQASDLKNFHESVRAMLSWCAGTLGLPLRYMGIEAVNPASEGAIVADEARLIKNVELMNAGDGDSWAWVGALYERFRTGEWLPANALRVVWENPATPTRAQIADAAVKLHAEGILSREGVWDEMGWDEARKDRERGYFAAEAEDPLLAGLMREVRGAGAGSGSGAVPVGAASVPVGVDGAAAGSRVLAS